MHTQDYEAIWNRYSKRFGKTHATAQVEHLGDEWANPELSVARFEKFVLAHLHDAKVVGELGVGGGKYSVLVAQYVSILYGIDIAQNMLDRTSERLKNSSCNFTAAKCVDSKIPLPNDSLDFFFSLDSMVHIFPYDVYSYIMEIGRILKSRSKAVFEFADWDQPGSVEKFSKDQEYFVSNKKLSPGAFGFISRVAIAQFGIKAGMKVLDFQEISKRSSVAVLQKL